MTTIKVNERTYDLGQKKYLEANDETAMDDARAQKMIDRKRAVKVEDFSSFNKQSKKETAYGTSTN